MQFNQQTPGVEQLASNDGISMIAMVLIALTVSLLCTFVLWKLGIIRFMAAFQTQMQSTRDKIYDKAESNPDDLTDSEKRSWDVAGGKLVGKKFISTYEFGTGKSAVLSFTLIVWISIFGLTMYGLIMYA
jgi:hypothetical protein